MGQPPTSQATESPVPTAGYWRAGYADLDAFNQVCGFTTYDGAR